MRLVNKLSLAFMIGTTAILAGNGYFRVRREVGLFRTDRVHDHDLIGRSLGASLQVVWRSEGQAAAMALIDAANAGESRIHFRWDWLDGPGAATDLHVDKLALVEMRPGSTITVIAPDGRGEDERFTYAPLVVGGGQHGALELSETLESERDYTRRTVYETMQTTGLLALVTALLSYVLGSFFVGGPVRA
ncbi:MAG TPA: histidine kinase, partial [Polyangiaceae bacterium]